MKVYKVSIGMWFWLLPPIVVAIPAILFFFSLLISRPVSPTDVFLVFTVGMFLLYPHFRTAYQITVNDDGTIEFRSLFRCVTVSPSDIKTVTAQRKTLGYVDIRYADGKVQLINQMDGFHEFLTNLKAANPSIDIKGC